MQAESARLAVLPLIVRQTVCGSNGHFTVSRPLSLTLSTLATHSFALYLKFKIKFIRSQSLNPFNASACFRTVRIEPRYALSPQRILFPLNVLFIFAPFLRSPWPLSFRWAFQDPYAPVLLLYVIFSLRFFQININLIN